MQHDANKQHINDIFDLPKDEALHKFYERVVTIPITVRTALKKELIATIGKDRTKGVFIRYGWYSGVSDAKRVLAHGTHDEMDLIKVGPKFHILHGYLDDVRIQHMTFDEQDHVHRIQLVWTNSFEAAEYLRANGPSDVPVCDNLCGYASGYLSTALNRKIIVKETACIAMGHTHCEAICMPLDQWDDTLENEDRYYQTSSMLEELDEVTAKLKQERDYLTKANDVLKQFTKALWGNQSIQKITDLLYETTGHTAYIENESFTQIAASANLPALELDSTYEKITAPTLYELPNNIYVLKAPIYYEHDIRGYCAYVYEHGAVPTELDYLLLDKASLTSSIIILNENIKISAEQNVKRNFLSDILEGRLAKEEVHKIAFYLKFPPNERYWMLTLTKTSSDKNEEAELALNEDIIRHVHSFLKERNLNAIVSQKANDIIMLIAYESFEALHIKSDVFLQQLFKHCARRFKKHTFAIGVSSIAENMSELPIIYNETIAALRVQHDDKHIYYFEDLELESLLFQLDNGPIVERFIEKELGPLLQADKDYDLTKTLLAYIENGININSTAKVLSMSISGLRYRLTKISDILSVELDDTKRLFSIYMALKVLRAKGKLPFNA